MPSSSVALGELVVRRLGLGTMSLPGPGVWGPPRDRDDAVRLLRRAAGLGVDFFDTADSYGPAVAEELVAEALHPYDGRPEHLRAACHSSLERLRVERIDLFQLHAVDPSVPLEESLGALSELRAAGKIRHVGVCNLDAGQFERALAVEPLVSVQNRFSLADRTSLAVIELCGRDGLAFIPWAPLAKGTLARPAQALVSIAAEREATPAQIALAWVLARSPATLPIPGTSSVAHLEENIGATAVELTQDDIDLLDRTAFAMPKRGGRLAGARRRLRSLVRR